MAKVPLAHSARGDVPAQTYVEHVAHVRRGATRNARRAAIYYAGNRDEFLDWVDAASVYHDLGKLDEANQAVLACKSQKALPIAHEDAGVAALERLRRQESVVLVAAHHAGLFSRANELKPDRRPFRQEKRETPGGVSVADYVDGDERLEEYLSTHVAAGCDSLAEIQAEGLHGCGFSRRIALSCLVDADHGDTARHYGREVVPTRVRRQWRRRLAALQRYVDALADGRMAKERQRNRLRREMFKACHDAPADPAIRACDAPVGSGKTTAVMAHLLRVACEKRLRHIFVVLPYTNIITQAVDVYRKALVLEGERPEDVVAEHHHQADFKDLELRQLATLWKAPVIVTTAVQFFETLGSDYPSRLRKLHELPGSAVFVDETHAAMPSHLWPQMWRWLETWTREWGGHVVLGSGSLPRFWESSRILSPGDGDEAAPSAIVPTVCVRDLVQEPALRQALTELEKERVRYRRRLASEHDSGSLQEQDALDCAGVIQFVTEKPGPRLLIVNTVQTAAVIAQAMREGGFDVLHLSTALAPAHRGLIVDRVKCRLREKIEDWTLVATSCVEAGMDFSFRTGFRERASTASLIQIGGRVSRGSEHDDAVVWDILLRDDAFRANPGLTIARQALTRISEDALNCQDPADLATRGMLEEWTAGAEEKATALLSAEREMEYREVARLCRVIEADTRMVVIDAGLVDSIRRGRKVARVELLRYSIQMWATRVNNLQLEPIGRGGELYAWNDAYDPDLLGYMAGVLRNQQFLADGGAIV